MAAKSTSLSTKSSPVAVDQRTMQSLFESVKSSHANLKGECKTLLKRCVLSGDIAVVKPLLLEYPPLHSLIEILDEVVELPLHELRPGSTSNNSPTDITPKLNKRNAGRKITPATKALRFSPLMFKFNREGTGADGPSTNTAVKVKVEDTEGSGADDDVVEIPQM